MNKAPINVLFLCTGNSARSIMAEVLLNALGNGKVVAHSAGSHPTGRVHPAAIDRLRQAGHTTEGIRSKSWDEFAAADAPSLDYVITLCGKAAGESCPAWSGRPISAHWGIPDPAAVEGSAEAVRQAFASTYRQLRTRIHRLLDLPVESMDRAATKAALAEIGAD